MDFLLSVGDRLHSYEPWVKVGLVSCIICFLLLWFLGPKRETDEEVKVAPVEQKAVNQSHTGDININAPIHGDSLISQNQSGGVMAHTVNFGAKGRQFDAQQEKQIIDLLKGFPNSKLKIQLTANDPELLRFGAQFEKILKEAGIQFEIERAILTVNGASDIQVRVKDKNSAPPIALPLANALNEMGFKVTAKERPQSFSNGDAEIMILVIGQRSPE